MLCSSQRSFTFMVKLQMPIQQLQGPRKSANERRHWRTLQLGVGWKLRLRKTLMGPPPLASASHESAATARVFNVWGVGCKKMHATSRPGTLCESSSRSMFDSLHHLTRARVSSFDRLSRISLFLDLVALEHYSSIIVLI